jgi:hypothetical protein
VAVAGIKHKPGNLESAIERWTMAAELSERVKVLEVEVAKLKQRVETAADVEANASRRTDWQSTLGLFQGDPMWDEALRLGQAHRLRQPKC